MKEMRTTYDRANGSLPAHCWEVSVDLWAALRETGEATLGFVILLACLTCAPLVIPVVAWHRRKLARREIAAWEARQAVAEKE